MKVRRGRKGLTKAEFLQREVDEEWAKRLEEALSNVKKKEQKKLKEEEEESK